MALPGTKRRRRYRPPKGFLGHRPPPFEAVERVGAPREGARVGVAIGLALGVHALLLFLGMTANGPPPAPPPVTLTRSVTLERPPPPPPPPTPPPPPEAPRPPVPRQARKMPPAAAVAGKVVARAVDPTEPVDMTGFAMPVGKGDTYAGGYTAATGTSSTEVTNPRAAAKGQSQARAASPARPDWACAWPQDEEQNSDIRDVRVTLRVHVDADGAPQSVDVLSQASPAFALAARHCALGETFRAARDDDGHPAAGTTSPFIVHFIR